MSEYIDILDDGYESLDESSPEFEHYGMPRRSGRYPWGSGDNPQRSKDFVTYVKELKKTMSEDEVAKSLGMSTTQLRKEVSKANEARKTLELEQVRALREKGMSTQAIADRVGISEASVRNRLKAAEQNKTNLTVETADKVKAFVDKNKYVDIGPGTELELGVTRTRLDNAVSMLEDQGYLRSKVYMDQMGTENKTTIQVLSPPGTEYANVLDHKFDIKSMVSKGKTIDEKGDISLGVVPPKNIDGKRILIKYAEDGGIKRDGVIEIRRGVEDISLGNSKYAQVRIAVDGKSYLKGMAMYGDIPKGYDIVFNTNKHKGTPFEKVLKTQEADPENPFGSAYTQRWYTDKNGKKQLSALNIVNQEGDWDNWSRNLPSQFLSKQSPILAKRQLDLAYAKKKAEYDEICSLSNPTIKKKLLASFSDDCDSSAVHLKAASFPRQRTQVLLPFTDIKDNEIYAPNFKHGEKVCLVRFPHGGTFEIPELTVNNKGSKQAIDAVGKNPIDMVGINHKVAERLSGADFDGDTALVIPVNSKVKIRSSKPLKGLEGFDPKEQYKLPDDAPKMKSKTKQTEMGKVSNLITDMTIMGATPDEIARAVRHSMVVIDAEKHHLDYKQSERDNRIKELKEKYQGGGGASTIVSRASAELRVPLRKPRTGINKYNTDPNTGEKIYTPTGETYKKVKTYKDGRTVVVETPRMEKSTKMAEAHDAYSLTSGGSKSNPGYRIEAIYAEHANRLKALGNEARKEYLSTPSLKYDPQAKKTYEHEVASLNSKLNEALKNAPRERQAQILANKRVAARIKSNPDLDGDHLKKIKGQELTRARADVGAKKKRVDITDREWHAIQKGAISDNKLQQILNNTDLDKLKQRATPRASTTLSSSQKSLAKSMASGNMTNAEIARRLNVSPSTISKLLAE